MSDQPLLNWVKGDQLIDWLANDLRAIDLEHLDSLDDRWERRVRAWKNEGQNPSVYKVDEFLCSLCIPLGLMPEEYYCEHALAGKPTSNPVSPGKSKRIATLRSLGWTIREIAAMVGVDRKTAERHIRKAAAA
jgi:hypothetical protein